MKPGTDLREEVQVTVDDPRPGVGARDEVGTGAAEAITECGIVDQEVDVIDRAGRGVDRTQFLESLRLRPLQRLRNGVSASKAIDRLVKSARRVNSRSSS